MIAVPFSMGMETNTVEHWQMRAAEARSMADSISDPIAEQTMMGSPRATTG